MCLIHKENKNSGLSGLIVGVCILRRFGIEKLKMPPLLNTALSYNQKVVSVVLKFLLIE